MRIFELHADDFVNSVRRHMFLDLDSVVSLEEVNYAGRTEWEITLSNDYQSRLRVTKAAFDRVFSAWTSS